MPSKRPQPAIFGLLVLVVVEVAAAVAMAIVAAIVLVAAAVVNYWMTMDFRQCDKG